jgi:UDPglucose 6-dehydrogenase
LEEATPRAWILYDLPYELGGYSLALPGGSFHQMSRVSVIGAGYVGLTTAAFLAYVGHDVCCADIRQERVAQLSRGEIPIWEDGLGPLVTEGLARGRLGFVVGASSAVAGREFVFLCLPTPQRPDGSADTSSILSVASEIGPVLSPGSIVVNKSTVPIGTARMIREALQRADVTVVSNPEFLRVGSALSDCRAPDRIIIGSDDEAAATRVASLFESVNAPILMTSHASAEAIKYASNAFLATRVSFINAIANLCEAVGADVSDVVEGMGYDRRIGSDALQPGPGWGGSCLPKDTRALIRMCEDVGYDFTLLHGVIAVNEEQQKRVVGKISALAGGSLDGATVAVWGLTFKAGTDDLRHSPAVSIARRVSEAGAIVRAYDPAVCHALPGVEICLEPYGPCQGASVLAVLTEWDKLRELDFDKVRNLMAKPCIVDARNLLDSTALRQAGFRYQGIGRT